MFKKYPVLKWSLIGLVSLVVILFTFGWWFMSLLPERDLDSDITLSQVNEVPYLSENITPFRGKILAVVTSVDTMGSSGKSTGYELTELARAYYVFQANGFEVDVASPKGGKPPVIIDKDDMGIYDYAFLNDTIAQHKTSHTIAIDEVNPDDYQAIFFAGGKGDMFDFPENEAIQSIVRNYYLSEKVIGAVCHGPAALVNVTLDSGRSILENKTVSGFTNNEELLLIPEAASIFPFLLQDKLEAQGARFNEGGMYLENISHDNNLVTGQNPWSTWSLAETMIAQLGYTPKYREVTAEENAVKILMIYESYGSKKAKEGLEKMITVDHKPIARELIAMHSIVAVMDGKVGRFFDIVGLTSHAKRASNAN